MQRRLSSIVLATATLIALAASPAAAASGTSGGGRSVATADHLGGNFRACGRIVAFTTPVLGVSDGSITIAGVVDGADHTFPIDDAAPVNPLVATLAAGGEWTCLHLMGDAAGVLVDVAVADHTSCGPLAQAGGTFVLQAGSTDPFTTTTLDGDAAAVIAADPDLAALLGAIATVDGAAEACLEFQLAADGTLAAMLLDYALSPGDDLTAPIACGPVDGTPIAYRDPASQPYPEGDTISVDGFEIDASLVEGPFQAVLAFHLDAGLELCLLVRIVDSAIVETAVITGVTDIGQVCGILEVIGGLVFVDSVVVSQTLTSINFAEPTPSSLDIACASALAEEGAAAGTLDICGRFDGMGTSTVTISGITFHLTGSVIAGDVPAVGTVGGLSIVGPHPFDPFGPANPAVVTFTTLEGCTEASPSPLPDTSAGESPGMPHAIPLALLAVLSMVGAISLATARVRRR